MVEPKKEALSAEAFANWLKAPVVADKVLAVGGYEAAINALADRLRVGLVRAAAANFTVELGEPANGPTVIPPAHWKAVKAAAADDLWQTGQLTVWVTGSHARSPRVDYYGVRFEPSGIEAMLADASKGPTSGIDYAGGKTWVDEEYGGDPSVATPPPAEQQHAPTTAKHPGGAPFKPFWDDLWAAMGGQILTGAIYPGCKLTIIEDAMVQWASDHGYELSKPSARTRARKLLAELNKANEALDKNDG